MSVISDIISNIEKSVLQTSSSGKYSTTDFHPGDINIIGITLLSEDQQRSYDLIELCKSIEIFESVLSPVIFAEIGIQDTIGLYQTFPILGEEYVKIEFQTPGTSKTSVYLLRVNNIHNKNVSDNEKLTTYSMQLVSAELIRNSSKFISKTFKDNIHKTVQDIINDELETEKPVRVESTSGIERGIITRMQPFKAVDYLRRRAVSKKYKSSVYVFFENRDGYNFVTIEKLIEDGKNSLDRGNSDKEFFFDVVRKENEKNVSIRNIIAYNQILYADTISKVQYGGITNEVNTIDLITGNVKKINYTDNIGQDQITNLDKNAAATNTSNFNRKHGKTTAMKNYIPISSDLPDTNRAEKLSISTAFAENIAQNIIQIHIYGDSEIQAGDVIKCNLPSATSVDDGKNTAKFESGNYLVTKVRHIITNLDRPQHTIALELIKGNLAVS